MKQIITLLSLLNLWVLYTCLYYFNIIELLDISQLYSIFNWFNLYFNELQINIESIIKIITMNIFKYLFFLFKANIYNIYLNFSSLQIINSMNTFYCFYLFVFKSIGLYLKIKLGLKFWYVLNFIFKTFKHRIFLNSLIIINKWPLLIKYLEGCLEWLWLKKSSYYITITPFSLLLFLSVLFLYYLQICDNYFLFFLFFRLSLLTIPNLYILAVLPLEIMTDTLSQEDKNNQISPLVTEEEGENGESKEKSQGSLLPPTPDTLLPCPLGEGKGSLLPCPLGEGNGMEEENINFNNFNNLTQQEKHNYVNNKINEKGLTPNLFLINYFISAILKNTSGSQIETDNFLCLNLDILLNDQRNLQLSTHSFTRFRPFFMYNSSVSHFPSTAPFHSDSAFKFEWQEYLEDLSEAKKNEN